MAASVGKIEPDAILESVIEIRFLPHELPEVTVGRLLTSRVISGLDIKRLPEADIPMSARESDENLMYQSVYQAECDEYLIRVGYSSISVHITQPYPGWDEFLRRARFVLDGIWDDQQIPPLKRCGLRYINALTKEDHGVANINDMNLNVSIGDQKLLDLSVNFSYDDGSYSEAIVRIASAKHVKGNVPNNTTFIVDIDVRTVGEIVEWGLDDVITWLGKARTMKNEQFFRLLPERVVSNLAGTQS